MSEPYGLPPGTQIDYRARGFPAWVDKLCLDWGLDSSTYPGHQEGDRPDIGSAPNPDHENRGIDWAGPADKMLAFAHWLVSIAPERQPGQYGPPGLEMVIYRHVPTGEDVTYPSWVDYSGDLPGHTDHVHTRQSAALIEYAPPPPVMTVPLTDNHDGTWTSPNPAWAHLIMRESGGNPTIIQQIIDVNSGGNEAEGLFQITPATWRTHKGDEFAPSARLATPQQQAIVAARIFTANPSGSDWGAGLPGREDAAELAAGLVLLIGPTPQPTPEEPGMAGVNADRLNQAVDMILARYPSRSMFATDNADVDDAVGMLLNVDKNAWDQVMIAGALLGVPFAVTQVERMARGDFPAGSRVATDPLLREIAQQFATKLLPLCGSLQPGSPPSPPPVSPPSPPPPSPPPPVSPPPPPVPPPPPPPVPPPSGPKPVLYCVNGFMGDMWVGPPADVGHALEDIAYFQPVGYASGAFPLGIGRDDGVRELKRLIRAHQSENPGRRFAFFGFSLGAVIVDDVFDNLRSGDMQQFWPYFLGGAKIGDPRREPHKWWGGPDDPGGQGIAGPRNLRNTPDNFRSYMYDNNRGDIYANAGINPLTGQYDPAISADMTMIYQFVMTEWDGALISLFAEAGELITKLGPTGVTIVMAIWDGIQFLVEGQAPHMVYRLDDAIAFLRRLFTNA